MDLHPNKPAPRLHTTVLAVDICAFGDPSRDDMTQRYLRHTMYELVTEAFNGSGIAWEDCHHEDRGDGVLVVAPADVPIEDLLDALVHNLASGLHDHNSRADRSVRLRLRLAVHTGLVLRDAHGVTGKALNHMFRLLEARAFKNEVTESGTDLGVIISDRLHRDAVDHGALLDLNAYRKIRIISKETRTSAWVRTPSP